MALIGKIRKNSWLLVVVIGGAMLFFILSMVPDLLRGDGPQEDTVGIGTVNGEMINEEQYNQYLNNARNSIFSKKQQQNPNQQATFTQKDENEAQSQAWQTSVLVKLMDKEYAKIGLIVDDYELENVLFGKNGYAPSSFSSQFTDSITGEFAPEQVQQYLDQMQRSSDPSVVQNYYAINDFVKRERLMTKYNALIEAGIHATTLEGKKEYTAKKALKNITYVYKSFTEVPKDVIGEPTTEELKAFYEAHKQEEKYQKEPSRVISYFTIPLTPSSQDSAIALQKIKKLIPSFEEADNDSLFVMRHSILKQYSDDSTAMSRPEGSLGRGNKYPKSIADEVASAKVGDVIGPYYSQQGVQISKVLDLITEKTATVRHILLGARTPEEFTAAQQKADSIINVIKANNNFEEMVIKFSEDNGSAANGGIYEDFIEGDMVKEFSDFSFNKSIGSLGTVKTTYGIHIVEVLEHGTAKFPIFATVTHGVTASEGTVNLMRSLASNFIYELDEQFQGKTIEQKRVLFDSIAVDSGYYVGSITSKDDNPGIDVGLGMSTKRGMLRLAYGTGAKLGNISPSPIRGESGYIVAFISKIVAEGVPKLEDVKDQLTAEWKKQQQAEYLIDKMAGKKDLQALAEAIESEVKTESVTFSANSVGVGREPQIIGAAFSGLKEGELSAPIKGNYGIFVLKVNSSTPAPETADYSAEMTQIEDQRQTSFLNQTRSAIMEEADIYDNRILRKYGIN